MCQVTKDTRTNLKLSKTQADIWSYWPGQNGTLHLVAPVPACAISVGLFSQTQHLHIWAHHHCPGLRESSLPVSLPRECGPLETKIDRRRRGETNTSVEQGSLTNTQLTSDSKGRTPQRRPSLQGSKGKGSWYRGSYSSCCRINFYIDPWSRSALMERVPSTEPKFAFLRLDQYYTQEGSQSGVTVTESCSFALQAGSQTLSHGRFVAEKGFISLFHSSKETGEYTSNPSCQSAVGLNIYGIKN